MRFFRQFLMLDDGATAVEYAVMLALILVAIISTVGVVGSQSGGLWGGIDTDLQNHGFGS